jgi:hypothetical protein
VHVVLKPSIFNGFASAEARIYMATRGSLKPPGSVAVAGTDITAVEVADVCASRFSYRPAMIKHDVIGSETCQVRTCRFTPQV